MPLLRLNASPQGLKLHHSTQTLRRTAAQIRHRNAPVVIMVHGYKYAPDVAGRCPHAALFHSNQWPQSLGLSAAERIGIAFGWPARGNLRSANQNAITLADRLAEVISLVRGARPVHLIAHSLGATLVLAALPALCAGDVGRIVLLNAAAHTDLAQVALAAPAGQHCRLFHVTSDENALFDRLYERLIPGSGALGRGFIHPRACTLKIDHPQTLAYLKALGYAIAPPARKLCHWSAYTRPGVMALNAALLNGTLSFDALHRQGTPTDI